MTRANDREKRLAAYQKRRKLLDLLNFTPENIRDPSTWHQWSTAELQAMVDAEEEQDRKRKQLDADIHDEDDM